MALPSQETQGKRQQAQVASEIVRYKKKVFTVRTTRHWNRLPRRSGGLFFAGNI